MTRPMIFSLREAESLALTIVDAQVAELNGIEEGEADGSGIVDGFELGALTFGLLLSLLEGFGEGLAVVDVDGDAEPVEDFAGLVADRLGANPPPAGMAVASANHAGFEIVVCRRWRRSGSRFRGRVAGRRDGRR